MPISQACLSKPFHVKSRSVQFIDTNMLQERTMILKPLKKFEVLEDSYADILLGNIVEKYKNKPLEMQQICLIDVVSKYQVVRLMVTNREKGTPLVVQFINFSETKEPERYGFERLILSVPFHDEQDLLHGHLSYYSAYKSNASLCDNIISQYIYGLPNGSPWCQSSWDIDNKSNTLPPNVLET